MEKFDVVIVGAGTAGCMAAKTSAEKGLKVCLIDRKKASEIGKTVSYTHLTLPTILLV